MNLRLKAPEFWTLYTPLSRALLPLSRVYYALVRLRWRVVKPVRVGIPVFCVGNVVAGGAGKTPVTDILARTLLERGVAAHVVSRGYGGSLEGPVRVDPKRHRAKDVGDEPLLLAEVAPVWVAKDRVAGMRAAVDAGAQALVLDDGFQNPSMVKDCSFVVIDGGYGFGNGAMLPAGPMREPAKDAFSRAQAVVLVGDDVTGVLSHVPEGLPVLHATLVPDDDYAALHGRRVYAFAGIGRPEKFWDTLHMLEADVRGTEGFSDHHFYTPRDLERLTRRAFLHDAQLVTTRKDHVRLPKAYRDKVDAVGVTLQFSDKGILNNLLEEVLVQGTGEEVLSSAEDVIQSSFLPIRLFFKQMRYVLEAGVFFLAYGVFRTLPLAWASAVGGAVARRVGPLLRVHRTAEANLRRAFPEKETAEIAHITRAMWDNLGRTAGEFAHLDSAVLWDQVTVEGAEHIEAAKAAGKGALFVSAHYGNWELAARTAQQQGYPLALVYRAANNPYVDALVARVRTRLCAALYAKGRDARQVVRAMKSCRPMGLLVDQKMNDGLAVPFFGRDAMTAPAVAELALKYDVPILPARVCREDGGRFTVTIFPPMEITRTGDHEADVRAIMTEIHRLLEDWIREDPGQWFWVHNRWPK